MKKSSHRQGPMLAALMAVLTLAGCAQLEIADRAVAYNKAVEDASNRILVLNIIRANKRYPRHFTDFTQLSGNVPLSGTFALQIPFGGDAASNFTFSPQSTVKSGISFDMKVQNTQEFMLGIIKPVSLQTYDFYFRQRWPKAMLFHVFVQEVKLKNGMLTKIEEAFKAMCKNNTKRKIDDRICISLLNMDKPSKTDKPSERDKFCKNKPDDKVCSWTRAMELAGKNCREEIKDANERNDPYVNAPTQECRFLRFQNLYRKLRVLDAEFKIVRKAVRNTVKTTTKQTSLWMTTKKGKKTVETWTPKTRETTTEVKPGGSVKICLSVHKDVKEVFIGKGKRNTCDDLPLAEDAKGAENAEAKNGKAKNGKAKNGPAKPPKLEETFITLKLRSPESMIYYLGEVTRVQNREDRKDETRYLPKVIFGPEKNRIKGPLFQLRKGSPGAEGATVTVSHEGETYYIPREKYGNSMGVLTLISTILATHKKGKDLPVTPSVRIIGG